MPGAVRIARAGPHDAPAMAAIHASSFAAAWDEASMARFLSSPEALCLIGSLAEPAQTPAGLLIARKAADEAEILTVCVAPPFRRQGLGRALIEEAIAAMRRAGAKRLFLEVEEENEAALSLYRALGAAPVGRRERYYANGKNAAILSLAL